MAYLDFDGALNGWLSGAEPDDFTWFDATRVLAANLVQRYAPTPDLEEVPTDYAESAAAAELFVGGWLYENRGRYTSLGGSGYSLSYTALDAIKSLVEITMPQAYLGDGGGENGSGEIIFWRGGPEAPATWDS